MELNFTTIQIETWRQYKSIDIKFHPRLTVITGPNGTGKSTILSILSRHFGYNRNYLSTPKKNRKTGLMSFSTGIFNWLYKKRQQDNNQQQINVGSVQYSNGQDAQISVPKQSSIQYNIEIPGQQNVSGIHIDSHRPPSVYRAVSNISTSPINKANISSELNGELQRFYNSGQSNQGTLFHIKSALIAMSMFGYGNNTKRQIG